MKSFDACKFLVLAATLVFSKSASAAASEYTCHRLEDVMRSVFLARSQGLPLDDAKKIIYNLTSDFEPSLRSSAIPGLIAGATRIYSIDTPVPLDAVDKLANSFYLGCIGKSQ